MKSKHRDHLKDAVSIWESIRYRFRDEKDVTDDDVFEPFIRAEIFDTEIVNARFKPDYINERDRFREERLKEKEKWANKAKKEEEDKLALGVKWKKWLGKPYNQRSVADELLVNAIIPQLQVKTQRSDYNIRYNYIDDMYGSSKPNGVSELTIDMVLKSALFTEDSS